MSVSTALFYRGLVVGFSIAAPVGPIGVLCIRRTIAQGLILGFVSGLGAATADAAYGAIAAYGLASLETLLVGDLFWLRLLGGVFLVYLGYRIFFSKPEERLTPSRRGDLAGAYISTLFLTLTNPMTILSFAAIFVGLGLGAGGQGYGPAGVLVLGVFLGSSLWWGILSSLTASLRSKVSLRGLQWVNRASAVIIGGFGLVVLAGVFR
jgi:threonine/homoserine/homoserine lactone efflux protein